MKYSIIFFLILVFKIPVFSQVALVEITPDFSEIIPEGVVVSDNNNGLIILEYNTVDNEIISLKLQKYFPIWRLVSTGLSSDYSNLQPEDIVSLAVNAEEKFNLGNNEKTLAEISVDFGKISICAYNKSIMDSIIHFYYIIGSKKYLLNEIEGHLTFFDVADEKITLGSISYGGSGYTSEISIYNINNIMESLRMIVPGRSINENHFDKISVDEESLELINFLYQRYDNQLNNIYKEIIRDLNHEKEEKLRIAQRSWLVFLENHIEGIIDNRHSSDLKTAITLLEKSRQIYKRIDELTWAYLSMESISN